MRKLNMYRCAIINRRQMTTDFNKALCNSPTTSLLILCGFIYMEYEIKRQKGFFNVNRSIENIVANLVQMIEFDIVFVFECTDNIFDNLIVREGRRNQ